MRPLEPVRLATLDELRGRIRRKSKLKGRQPDHVALEEVRALIGPAPHRRDLLIEHLHRLNDEWQCLHDRHLVALAREMNLPMAEVFEVATFYHHFEVLRGDDQPAALTVRVCDGLSCELAGARDLLQRLPALLGAEVRVVAAPCVGRCEQAPVAVVGQAPVVMTRAEDVAAAVGRDAKKHPLPADDGVFDAAAAGPGAITSSPDDTAPAYVGYRAYQARGSPPSRPRSPRVPGRPTTS